MIKDKDKYRLKKYTPPLKLPSQSIFTKGALKNINRILQKNPDDQRLELLQDIANKGADLSKFLLFLCPMIIEEKQMNIDTYNAKRAQFGKTKRAIMGTIGQIKKLNPLPKDPYIDNQIIDRHNRYLKILIEELETALSNYILLYKNSLFPQFEIKVKDGKQEVVLIGGLIALSNFDDRKRPLKITTTDIKEMWQELRDIGLSENESNIIIAKLFKITFPDKKTLSDPVNIRQRIKNKK